MSKKILREIFHKGLFFSFSLCLFGIFCLAQNPLVIKAGTVLIGNGDELRDVFVVVEDGKIVFVGKGYVVKPDVHVLDFADKVVTPGFIAANAHMDVMRQANEEGEEVTPRINVLYSVDPRAKDFDEAWRSGVTSVYLAPGNLNVFPGMGTILKTKGPTPQDMLVQNQVHLKMVLGREPGQGNSYPSGRDPMHMRNRRPQNRMGVVFIIRYELTNMQNKRGLPDTELTPDELVFRQVLKGRMPLRISARSYMDIKTAFRLMEEFGYRWILEGGVDAYRYLDELEANDIPVIYGPVYKNKNRGDFNREDDRYMARTPVLLAEKGIRFAFQNNAESPISALRDEAIHAVELGLAEEKALIALTLDAARILGISDRLGSIAKGKNADLLVFDGNPFEPSSSLLSVVIDGKFYDPNK
ncbi:MAG: amidohydrolase family protein [Candidatus Aminicenantes bacterium]|nr:MAG: amidohydrolase family protein [Candidatus Aminicenantes bacterium]